MNELQPNRHVELYDGKEWQEMMLWGKIQRNVSREDRPTALDFDEAVLHCIRHPQVSAIELYDPPGKQMNEIHYFLAEDLGVEGTLSNLKIFPSLYTSADHEHGVDCIIVFTDPETGKEAIVTVDLSINSTKYADEHFKADVLLKPDLLKVRRFPSQTV